MTNGTVVFITRDAAQIQGWADLAEHAGYRVHELLSDVVTPDVLAVLSGASVIIEWLPAYGNKKSLFWQEAASSLQADVLVLSAAHDQMVTTTASEFNQPGQVVGFSPMAMYRSEGAVTLARHRHLGTWAEQAAQNFFLALKLNVCWIQDTPGMVLPRIYAMLANEAAFALQEQVASAQDIDTAMRLGTNYPQGPLTWADHVGLDTVLAILDLLWKTYREERYRPCLLIQQLVEAGHLGVVTGQGFYHYSPDIPSPSLEAQAGKSLV